MWREVGESLHLARGVPGGRRLGARRPERRVAQKEVKSFKVFEGAKPAAEKVRRKNLFTGSISRLFTRSRSGKTSQAKEQEQERSKRVSLAWTSREEEGLGQALQCSVQESLNYSHVCRVTR